MIGKIILALWQSWWIVVLILFVAVWRALLWMGVPIPDPFNF